MDDERLSTNADQEELITVLVNTTGVSEETARAVLEECSWNIDTAIEMQSAEVIQEPPSSPTADIDEPSQLNESDQPSSPVSNGDELNESSGNGNVESAEDDDGDVGDKAIDETVGENEGELDLNGSQSEPNAAGSDEEPDTTNKALVDDVFGNSEDEEDFEGFGKGKTDDNVAGEDEEENGPQTTVEDVDDENEGETEQRLEEGEPSGHQQDLDTSDEELDRDRGGRNDIVYDFDLMMQRKKEENYRRRKRKNIDIINDSDDVIAELISQMKQAADDDFELNKNRQPALCKIKLLPKIEAPLRKIDLREAFLDAGVLDVITDWLTPLPDRSLPNIKVRETMLTVLHNFNITDSERLEASGIGKAIMYISKHPKESKENKNSAKSLITKWSRFIFNLESDFHSVSREEREQRDFDNMSRTKRARSDSNVEDNKKETKRPGDNGWVPRARVPQPSNRDYVNRPKSSVESESLSSRGSGKKHASRLQLMQRSYLEKKRATKATRAVNINIEGRKM